MYHRIGFNKSLLQVLPEIVSISYSKFENDFPSYMHSHTASEIIFVINGHGSLDMLSESYPMERGSILLVNRNVLHTERQLPDIGDTPTEYRKALSNKKKHKSSHEK